MSKAESLTKALSVALPHAVVTHNLTGGPILAYMRGALRVIPEVYVVNGQVSPDWIQPVKSWDTFERNCEAVLKFRMELANAMLPQYRNGTAIITVREAVEERRDDRGNIKRWKVMRVGVLFNPGTETP